MKRPSRVLITFGTLTISLILAECGLRIFVPYPDPFAGDKTTTVTYIPSSFPPHFRFRFDIEEGLPGIEQRESIFTVNNMGFRGDTLVDPKPEGKFRIFLVGGSTTECRVIDDSRELGRALQNQLRDRVRGKTIEVFNAGKSGDKSFDHIAMISHRIIHLQPDLIVLFAGMNDFIAAANREDYLHFTEPSTQLTLGPLLAYAASEFQIGRRIFGIINKLGKKTDQQMFQEIGKRTNVRQKAKARMSRPVSNEVPVTDLAHYKTNLLSIIGITRAHGVPLVLMTQATTWNSGVDPEAERWHWMALAFNQQGYREDLLDNALESYNDVMRELAASNGLAVLDIARLLPKSLEFFYDDCHFNVKGVQTTAAMLSDLIVRKSLIANHSSEASDTSSTYRVR